MALVSPTAVSAGALPSADAPGGAPPVATPKLALTPSMVKLFDDARCPLVEPMNLKLLNASLAPAETLPGAIKYRLDKLRPFTGRLLIDLCVMLLPIVAELVSIKVSPAATVTVIVAPPRLAL